MPSIQWLLAVLRRFILGNSLVRASIRRVLCLFSILRRATKKRPATGSNSTDDSQTVRVVYPQAAHYEDGHDLYPALPTVTENRVAASLLPTSLMPASLHPYMNSGPSGARASRSSQDITAHPNPITQESYSLHSLSVQHLPGTLSVHPPTATLSVQNLPALPPSPNLVPGGYLPSTNSSVVDFHLPGPATESPSQSRRSSGVYGDIAVPAPRCLNDVHERIFPGTPETIARYSRKTIIPDEPTVFSLNPLTISALPNPPPPEEKRVFTDANLFDSETLKFINDSIRHVKDFLRAHNVHLDPGVDLVLDEYIYEDKTKGCQYYFVNHQGRCVFWMDKGDSSLFPVTDELRGMTSASHIRHELEAQYWLHCEYYPRAFEVTHEIVDELRDIVLHAFGDVITSQTSTVSWKMDDLKNMITLIDGFSKNVGKHADKKFSGSSCLVGRLMHVFARNRVYNFHGEPGARLNVDQSVHAVVQKRTMLIRMLSPLLFYAPDFHLVGLHAINTDGLIRHRGWSEFVTRLNSEWQEFTLYATVVLNANVAFLAIQSVDNNGAIQPNRSPTQISSYLSMLTSIGSIIIGLLLVKHHRNRDRASASDAATFICNRTHPTLGFETLAVLYSLPYAMLIWSMVSFLAAFSFMCFEHSSLVTRTLVAVVWTAVAALILWCIFNSWESSDWDWLRGLVSLSCFRGAADDGEAPAQQDEAKSAVTVESKQPKKRRWSVLWPSITLRKGSWDSERTVTNNV
ncbi:hypothetical protein MVEN_00771400 [Mycena venus]|uniref:Uncharacterized protein n=1 Tax=Mycena venus TaxID=2733690 RepID=A0A8H7D365_9AGAR|nr:hypothetical protein MVEN_00771400 [Mycena venus]